MFDYGDLIKARQGGGALRELARGSASVTKRSGVTFLPSKHSSGLSVKRRLGRAVVSNYSPRASTLVHAGEVDAGQNGVCQDCPAIALCFFTMGGFCKPEHCFCIACVCVSFDLKQWEQSAAGISRETSGRTQSSGRLHKATASLDQRMSKWQKSPLIASNKVSAK